DIKENLNQIDERFCEAITNTIDSIYNEILKAFLPDSIEDKVIKIKDQVGLSKLSKNVENLLRGFINNKGEKDLTKRIKALDIEKQTNTLISNIEDAFNLSINEINKLENNKKTISKKVEEQLNKEIKSYISTFEKNDQYISEWEKFYKSKDFKNMDKVYKKIEKNVKNIIPIEEKIKEVRELENLHLRIKMKGGDFNLTNEEIELAKKLV
ncbi:MAG: hypothetical protein HFJ20_03880, partial [Clostridia bacterium]|nr:hypothetical protein [Clostridia bacterium]